MVAGTQTPDNFLLLVSRLNLYDPLSVNPHPDKNRKSNLQQVGCLWLAFSSFSAEMWRLQLKLSFGSLVTWHLLLFWINVNQLLMPVVDYRLVLLLLLVLTRERLQFKLSFGGEWTLTEWTRLSAPLSSGLSTHSLLLRPGCWPRWSSGHSVIFIQIWHFCICIRVHIPCTCLHVLPLPPSTCWLLTLLLFIVSTLQSFGLCFENLWTRSSGNMFLF